MRVSNIKANRDPKLNPLPIQDLTKSPLEVQTFRNPFGNLFGNPFGNLFTQIQHGETNYKLATQIQHGDLTILKST